MFGTSPSTSPHPVPARGGPMSAPRAGSATELLHGQRPTCNLAHLGRILLYLVVSRYTKYSALSGPDLVKYPVHTRDHGRAWTAPRARDPDPVRSASPSVPDSPSHAARPVPSPRATANESSIPSRRVRARPESGVRILHVYVSRRSRSRRRGAARRGSRDMIISYDRSLAARIGRYDRRLRIKLS